MIQKKKSDVHTKTAIVFEKMSAEIIIGRDVEDLVNRVINKYNLKNVSEIKYLPGSQAGDGYMSKTIAVDILNGKEDLRLFLKCASNVKSSEEMPIENFYSNEIYFYDVVYPTYQEFLRKKSISDGFFNVPKCYATSKRSNMLALENLKHLGYQLYDRRTIMNKAHLEFVMKTFAEFHAVSYAFKDQEKEKYKSLVDQSYGDMFTKMATSDGLMKTVKSNINDFLVKLDPVEDKDILERCEGLPEVLVSVFDSAERSLNEYSILTQGDCWCNNMMFLYENGKCQTPKDIRLVDWQLLREASPVFDLSYFFYTIASEEALQNFHHYLKTYHDALCYRIRQLGSDPNALYPEKVFREEWKRHCKFGYSMAFILIKIMLSDKDEVMNTDGLDFTSAEDSERLIPKLKDETEFLKRTRALTVHMIKNDFI